jgi:cytochrome c6
MKLQTIKRRTRKLPSRNALALVAGLLITVVTMAASPAAAEDSAAGASVYKSKCVTCHGQDGGGTAVGKSLQVADLRSEEVQKKSDADLIQAVSEGKGNMPGFKGDITDDEVHAVVTFVRTLAAKGDPTPKKK